MDPGDDEVDWRFSLPVHTRWKLRNRRAVFTHLEIRYFRLGGGRNRLIMKEMSEQSSYHSSSTSSPLRFLIWGCLNWRERCDNDITDLRAIPTLLLHDMCTHISEEGRHIPHIIHLLRLPSEFLPHFHFHKDECRKSEANRIHKQVTGDSFVPCVIIETVVLLL